MYEVQFSPLAKQDLIKIIGYLEEAFDNEIASEKIRQLLNSIRKFETFPLLGRPLMNVIDIPTDYMYFVVDKNYVFYRLEKETVKIIRIIDTRQDYIDVLFG
ncbi:MAG: type II toxin-antitoxin system RelE/ParE family toxin [Firmicutes bacterium]|nr:type II toxin-antitoxin system RelE/ParE family toxin [Bacillota bacterium]